MELGAYNIPKLNKHLKIQSLVDTEQKHNPLPKTRCKRIVRNSQ